MNGCEQRTITRNDEQEEAWAMREWNQMVAEHQALKKVMILIQGSMLRVEQRMFRHANWMGAQGWEVAQYELSEIKNPF